MDTGWKAQLELTFAKQGEKTRLIKRKQLGPLTLQRPFYPDGKACHVYLLHPPGGIVGGDNLHISLHANENSHTLITTPAAGKFYRSAGRQATQTVNIRVDNHAMLEWLPQETILYDGAKASSTVNVALMPQAHFIGWEILSLGRPASGEGFENGQAQMTWQISRDDRPLFLERLQLDAKAFWARWGLNGYCVCGTLFAVPVSPGNLEAVRDLIGDTAGRGVTQIDDMLICRALDSRTDRLRVFFEQVWKIVRQDTLGHTFCIPRIWAT